MSRPVKPLPEVRIGQVWADNDKRAVDWGGRYLRIVEVGDTHVTAVLSTSDGQIIRNRPTVIRRDRMRPTSTGYRLHRESPR